MKKLFLSNGKTSLYEVPNPQIIKNTILVQTRYSFVSKGTELATLQNSKHAFFKKSFMDFGSSYEKLMQHISEKGFLSGFYQIKSLLLKKIEVGYSSSGVVLESQSDYFKPGDIVACAGFGHATHSELAVIPENLAVKIKDKKFIKQSSITTLGAIALHALRRGNLQLGENIGIIGMGLLGQLQLKLAKMAGLNVFAIDTSQSKLDAAKDSGASHVFQSDADGSFIKGILDLLDNVGLDAVFICASSTNQDLVDQAVSLCRMRGKVIIVGNFPIIAARENLYKKEIDLLISCSYGPGRYDENYEKKGLDYPIGYVRWTENRNLQCVADMICAGSFFVDDLISNVYSFEDDLIQKAYSDLEKDVFGLIFEYSQEPKFVQQKQDVGSFLKVQKEHLPVSVSFLQKGSLDCALVGAGAFAKSTLAPILTSLSGVNLSVVCDLNASSLLDFQATFGFSKITSDCQEVLNDGDVDVIFLATPEDLHARQIISFLSEGKAVFCEKPLVTEFEQLYELQSYLKQNKEACFAVDFNRSFSPLIQKLQDLLSSRKEPLIINYRVSASGDYNVSSKIISEICHFIELFLNIVKAKPSKLTASFSSELKDNLVASLTFVDGSVATLIYVTNASKDLFKERAEFYWEEKTVIIEDFKNFYALGFGEDLNESFIAIDKGHKNNVLNFLSLTKAPYGSCSEDFHRLWQRYFLTSYLTLSLREMFNNAAGELHLNDQELNWFNES